MCVISESGGWVSGWVGGKGVALSCLCCHQSRWKWLNVDVDYICSEIEAGYSLMMFFYRLGQSLLN